DWPHHYTGLMAHWNKNSNLAWAFDTWFLNLFPRKEHFTHNSGGYATLSFIPTLGTMILGLIAGGWLAHRPEAQASGSSPAHKPELPASGRWQTVGWFVLTGAVLMGLGVAADRFGICP